MTGLQGDISDISHNETILLGLAVKQSEHLREMRSSLVTVNKRLDSLEITVNKRLDSLEATVNEHTTRFDRLEATVGSLQTTVNEHTTRFDRLETMLTQVLARLPEKP